MKLPDYEKTRAILVATDDQQMLRLVRIMDPVFRRPKFRPNPDAAARAGDIVAAGRDLFPTPFARQFATWSDDLAVELEDALATWSGLAAGDARRAGAERRVRLRFRSAALQIETCWRQIVHFLPFIFIAALRRVDDDVLRGDVAKEVARALRNYNAFYVQYSIERQREAVQYLLLASLLKLFRQLTQRKAVGPDFLFESLMAPNDPSFSDVFPERFDAGMLFLQEVRNRLTHGGLVDRLPAEAIGPVGDLIAWVFLDLIDVLRVPCRAFALHFVTASRVGPSEVDVETLDFSGVGGPQEARYRISKEWQLEEYALLPYRTYLVARDKAVGANRAGLLAPRDYLDLTPFLIADRLRARPDSDPLRLDDQLLFVLQQYLEPVRQLLFSDLGGTGDRLRPADARDTEADGLLRQMGDFRNRYRSLIDQVTMRDQKRLSRVQLQAALWRISRDHLATLVDVDRYDENGAVTAQQAGSTIRTVYIDELFVEPQESRDVEAFLSSGKQALLLVGDSGAGKSNLLVHHFLARLQGGEPAVFLSGRRFDSSSFPGGLLSKVVARISDAWTSLESLGNFLEENDEILTVFVDALNEYSGPNGPRSLLESLVTATGSVGLRRCKIVASIRNETWTQYCAYRGQVAPLDPALFAAPGGRPLRVGRFAAREALYAAYQRYYRLRPESLASLSPLLQVLVDRPFMMAMIAETYANPLPHAAEDGEAEREIPADLDYFSLFERLTERKARDAQVLVPAEDVAGRAAMPAAIEDFCALLAGMLFEQLVSEDPQLGSSRDALPIDSINKRAELEPFVQNRHAISVLEAVLQVGLLEHIVVPLRNGEGKLVPSAAFKFFHDQYTQYCLAAVYQRKILGWLDDERLANGTSLDDLIRRIDGILGHAVTAPVLSGGLDHWLQKNLANFHDGRVEPILPLLDRFVAHGSPALRHEAVAMLANMVLRGALPARQVYRALFQAGSPALRLAMVDSFIAFWPQLQPAALRSFIDCCDPRRDFEVIDRLGDVFALHVAVAPAAVIDFLDKAIIPLSFASIGEPMRIRRQARFAAQFAVFSVFSCFDRPEAMRAVRVFVRAKYRSVLDLVDDTGDGSMLGRLARRTVRQVLFKLFDSLGVAWWNKFIAAMEPSGNDKFFVEHDGVVQHELLARFLPYVVDLHNGSTEKLSLEPGSAFRELVLHMLDFRPASVIGYNATIALPSILMGQDWSVTRSIVMELIERRTPSAVFFGQLLLSNLAFSDRGFAQPALELLRDDIIPALLLADDVERDWSMSFCIASLDVERLWPTFEGLLRVFFGHFDRLGDAAACRDFGDHLYKVCYCSDPILGRSVIVMMLRDRERFLGPLWRDCTMKVLAALQTRNPASLYAVLAAEGADESLAREAGSMYETPEIVKQCRLFPFQVDVNRFVAWIFVAEPRLRYAIVKYFIGSVATGESVADFSRGVRQTLVALLNVFFGDHPESAPSGPLSLDEIAGSVAAARGRGSTASVVTPPRSPA
jgi:hypothetical protein